MKDIEKKIALVAIGPVWIFFITYLVELLSFALTATPNFSLVLVGVISAGALPRIVFNDRGIKLPVFTVVVSLILISSCFIISSAIYDTSFDGQTYHQLAIDLLRNGFNPYSSNLTRLSSLRPEYQLPLYHYPKFPWIIEATLFGVSGIIEGAKSLNLILLICSGLLAYLALLNFGFNRFNGLIIAAALALNPVVICQLWTTYIDGLLGSMSLFMLSALGLFSGTQNRRWIHISGIALIILLHIKFTAIVTIGSLFIVLVIGAARKSADSYKIFSTLLAYLLIGVIVIGWHPYVTNILATGNPIYPVAGYSPFGKTPPPNTWPVYSLAQGQQPGKLMGMVGPLKTFYSIAAKSGDPVNSHEEYQFFWEGGLKDFSQFVVPDLRLGGFGPLFPVILLISLLGLIRFKNNPLSRKIIAGCLIIIISSLLNPESWWSRYSPQLWLLPVLFALTSKSLRVVQILSLLSIISSLIIFFVNTSDAISKSDEVENTLRKLAPYQNSSLSGETLDFYANQLRLNKLHINLIRPEHCETKIYFAGSPSYVCL